MSAVDRSALPAEVSAALQAVFGDAAIDELALMSGGLSGAMVLSFAVDGAEYVLRRGVVARAPRELACMRIASDRGVAPRLHHADAETAVVIMDRVGAPLGRSGPGDPRRVERVAATLRRLHEGPAFPRTDSLTDMLRFFEKQMIARSGEGFPAEITRTLEEVTPCLARYAETAPCHNDLNPNNVLEANERIFFVDWEVAGAGDPFVDLAQLGVFAFPQLEQREALLEAYLARRPSEEEAARAAVARVVALAAYAAAFFMVRSFSGAPRSLAAPLSFSELRATLAASRERADPGVVAAALQLEMQKESASDAVAKAKACLAACGAS